MNLAATPEEKLAFLSGQLAAYDLVARTLPPSTERLRSFHVLRVAARLDPSAAYTLGKFLADRYHETRRTPTLQAALEMYELAVSNGLDRLRDPTEPFKKAPVKERGLRDMLSRSLTNIGAEMSNAGHPDRATPYFQQSIQLFPDNANAHVCLGRMGIFFSDSTGVDPLDGMRSWERATRLKDSCHESTNGCPCRVAFVKTVKQVEGDYGPDAARVWVLRAAKAMGRNKRVGDFGPVAASADDFVRLSQSPAPAYIASSAALELVDAVGIFFEEFDETPLEVKVTVAATLLMRFADARARDPGAALAEIMAAKEALGSVHPLKPFLGDDEWEDLGPPATLHLLKWDFESNLLEIIEDFWDAVSDLILRVPLGSLASAVLFHLDPGFRGGVTGMVSGNLGRLLRESYFTPAVVIGSPTSEAH